MTKELPTRVLAWEWAKERWLLGLAACAIVTLLALSVVDAS